MALTPLIQLVKDYAMWEFIGGAAFFGRNFFKRQPTSAESAKASGEGSMFLTPDGWETDKRRFNSSAPITP